jgi:hypothetical protein
MKKVILLFCIAYFSISAQNDTIFRKNGKIIPCTITYVNEGAIFYKDSKDRGFDLTISEFTYYSKNGKRTSVMPIENRGKDMRWEIIDSLPKSKNQIYSDTKMFIADYWKSAQSVIQNDDKDAGMILIKGSTRQPTSVGLGTLYFWYSYTVKFLMKDNKYKLIVVNIHYSSGPNSSWDSYSVSASDENPGVAKSGLSDKSWNILMLNLRAEMQSLVDSYQTKIKVVAKSDW